MVNYYNKERLKLFYFEPSELSFQVSIILIFIFYYFINEKNKKQKIKYGIFFILLTYILSLSKGMGGILCLIISCIIMYTIYNFRNNSTRQILINYIVIGILIIIVYVAIKNNNAFYLRVADIINGNDPSGVYRYNTGFKVMKNALTNTKGIGIGFGNLNTENVRWLYQEYGLVEVIANSFMYFISEGGIFSIIYLFVLIKQLIKDTIKSKSMLKYALLFFILAYQIPGGYFTNPMNWIVYGVICSNFNNSNYLIEGVTYNNGENTYNN